MTPCTPVGLPPASLWGAALVGLMVVAGPSLAAMQDAPPSPPTGEAAEIKALPGLESSAKKVPALLREGTFLTRAAGVVREDSKRHEWTFTPDAADRSGLRREFILLPNEPLGEAVRTARLAPSPIGFEVSGEVFIYRGRNYLLPSLMTPFVIPSEAPPTANAAKVQPKADATTKPAAPVDEEAIANELERKLAERIDRLPKAPVTPPSQAPANAAADVASPAAGNEAASSKMAPMRGDTRIQSRRGQLLRDNATGGWRFVFDGQLPDGGEPSMPVLPCLALERVETMVRQSDVSLPLVVTGTTTVFEGRVYLLPTIFRAARGGKGINP